MEHAVLEASSGEFGKKALDRIQPRARSWREMKCPPRMPAQPAHHLGVLVGRIIVEDDMDRLFRRHLAFDGIEEFDELLMGVALHILADDAAIQHIQRGEQCRVHLHKGTAGPTGFYALI